MSHIDELYKMYARGNHLRDEEWILLRDYFILMQKMISECPTLFGTATIATVNLLSHNCTAIGRARGLKEASNA